jgi:phosphoglycolate phosphatase-like HAD superfamily hydrolase
MKVLITDLDNTLYDWVTFFATAFDAMVDELVAMLDVPRERLLDEFKAVHRRHGSSEKPFAALELPSVRQHFHSDDPVELTRYLATPFATFNRVRRETLRLYPGVRESLELLRLSGVVIVAHTEAPAINAYHRLELLGVSDYVARLYVRDGGLGHPDPQRRAMMDEGASKIRVIRPDDRKPEPRLLIDICHEEGVAPADAWYVGDSLTRDIAMANAARVRSIWAKYGTEYDAKLWQLLVSISHWSDDDVAREASLRATLPHVHPTWTIETFAEVPHIIGVTQEVACEAGRLCQRS